MFSNKKGKIMRHPYITLAVIGLAAVGVMSITDKVKCFCKQKGQHVTEMMNNMKMDGKM